MVLVMYCLASSTLTTILDYINILGGWGGGGGEVVGGNRGRVGGVKF